FALEFSQAGEVVTIRRPCALVVSAQVSCSDLNPAPRLAISSRMLSRSRVERANRSSRVTIRARTHKSALAGLSNVRFAPKATEVLRCREASLCATTGLMHRSRQHSYSITSLAMASRVGGTSRPSALAVLRLMARSYLVGA